MRISDWSSDVCSSDLLPDIARWTMAGNAEWGTSVGETGYAYVRGDVQYVGPRPSELGPTSLPVADYTLVNLRVGHAADAGTLEARGRFHHRQYGRGRQQIGRAHV